MRSGYECQNCGYEPGLDELARGSCPRCAPARVETRRELPARLDALPVGSSVQVLGRPEWRSGGYVERTLLLWTKSEPGVWCSKRGGVTFYDADGERREVYVPGYAEERYHDPLRMTSEAVAHFAVGETTYGARIVVHDVTPKPLTDRDITRLVFLTDMGWKEAS